MCEISNDILCESNVGVDFFCNQAGTHSIVDSATPHLDAAASAHDCGVRIREIANLSVHGHDDEHVSGLMGAAVFRHGRYLLAPKLRGYLIYAIEYLT